MSESVTDEFNYFMLSDRLYNYIFIARETGNVLLQVWERLAWDQVALRDKSVVLFHYNMYSVLGFINNYLLRLWIWSFWLATEVTLIICLFFESAHIFNLRISFYYFIDHGECNWKILVFIYSPEISNLICFYLSSLISDQHIRFNNLILKSFIVSVYFKACEHDWENNAR